MLHFLPRRFELDGATKFTLFCGPRPCDESVYTQVLGTSWYYVEDFDFAAYYAGSAKEREEAVLTTLVDALVHIAAEHSKPTELIREAGTAVRDCGFFIELSVKKLSRSTADRGLRLNVFRRLSHEDGEAWGIRVLDRRGVELGTEWITDHPDYLDRTTHFNASRWADGVFQIVQRTPECICYTLDINKYRYRIQAIHDGDKL